MLRVMGFAWAWDSERVMVKVGLLEIRASSVNVAVLKRI